MVVATEELSRASLGVGGSLITRPEILTRALVRGGTEEQKQHWLPRIASAEAMVAVAVTEPDYGSDVAGVKVTATAGSVGLGDQWRQDLVHLRRPRRHPDAAGPHRPRPRRSRIGGSACSSCPSPRATADGFVFDQADLEGPGDGRLEGRPIDTIGYRGMHSYELAFDRWWVPGRLPDRRARRDRAKASTTRWRASRTAGCRPRPGPSGSCKRPTRRPGTTRSTGSCSADRSASTS